MAHWLPSAQSILVGLVERGEQFLPILGVLALAGLLWALKRRRRMLRYLLAGTLAVVTLVSAAALVFVVQVRAEITRRTRALAFRTLDDEQSHRVADWRGHVVVVNFWATWCLPCRKEMPELARLARAERGAGVVVLTLTDEDRATVERWEDPALRATTRALFTDDAPPSGLASVVLRWRPVTLVLDRNGRVRDLLLGPQRYSTLENAVHGLL